MNNNVLLMITQLETIQNLDIKAYVQAIIALETNNYNQTSLDELYDEWIENDLRLISDDFLKITI
ncbi:hypothetical protein FEZ33_00545 [Ruoffia tabacinasalis]|uniref:Uncharacterized protein n=1 Tax=Ruoffia tabacinasalis TaxID=87458 RepID=A0A5R9EJC6_9LACT|nr:hypothetical protein [Ruoffia tabacinasalis]TLQ49509.1 hypothetical protein FEZ33_00545 [Ruoffia tabacinasalis]